MKRGFRFFYLTAFLLSGSFYLGAQSDSVHLLNNVEVKAKRPEIKSLSKQEHTITPLDGVKTLGDIAKLFQGVILKDYGGIGGIKTVSVRGMGANHTAVSLDGVALSDCQTGQINIGKLSLEGVQSVEFTTINADEDIFKTARLFAVANVLNVRANDPSFTDDKPVNVRFSLKIGPQYLCNPFLLLENKWSKNISSSLSAEYLYGKGNYPYKQYYGGATDSMSIERRKNADAQALNTVFNFFYKDFRNDFNLKAYLYYAQKGLPGAALLYLGETKQRLTENDAFVQAVYQRRFSQKIRYKVVAKLNYTHTRYLDPLFLNTTGGLDNRYYQREYYLSNVLMYQPCTAFSVSASNDVFYNSMSASMENFVYPSRLSVLTNVAMKYKYEFVCLYANVVYAYINDKTKIENDSKQIHRFSPAVNVEFVLSKKVPISLLLNYQNVFRMPTFNDLYYVTVGNKELNPEKVNQTSIGLFYKEMYSKKSFVHEISLKGFYHFVEDKIVAIPSKNLFIWTMLNFGKVHSYGIETSYAMGIKPIKWLDISLLASYSWTKAIDVTDPDSKTYKNQIPYTPEHNASLVLNFETHWVNLSYTFFAVSERYVLGQNIPANRLEPYFDHSLSVGRNFKLKKIVLFAQLSLLNLANKNYEVVNNFPVEGLSYRLKIGLKY